jgi:queuine tRNA-ribosyltransferase
MIEFAVTGQSTRSRARLGILTTPHGRIETPALVPVATQATVKTLTSEEAAATGCTALIANTFHLHLRPGADIVRKAGGLHFLMNWPQPLMTDSGGYQVFSLGFGSDHGVGKILKEKREEVIRLGQQPQRVKITDEGVHFKSPLDGRDLFLGPKESIDIQQQLGADIIFAFDEATSPVADEEYTAQSLVKTHRWAALCLEYKTGDQALYGIVQGGKFPHLRQASARAIGRLPFAGFGIGGEYGDDKTAMTAIIDATLAELPPEKPRHLLGIGHLDDIPKIIKAGIDTFDCIVPTHYARHGTAFTSTGKLDLKKAEFLTDQAPLDSACSCPTCAHYKRAYISHLLRAKEITALRLLTFHNLHFFNHYVASLREKIKASKL